MRRHRPARPNLTRLEDRTAPAVGNPAPVPDTTAFPNSATVHILAVWDADRDGRLGSGDDIYNGSGAVIDNYHVLTAGHVIYDNDPATSYSGYADYVFVYAGQNGALYRPYGEARADFLVVPPGWEAADANSFQFDLGVITLDRNLGVSTGAFGYGGAGDDVVKSLDLQLLSYPAEAGFDGNTQQLSDGRATGFGTYEITYPHSDIFTAAGSSGAPVFFTGELGGSRFDNLIVAVHARGDFQTNEATRLLGENLEFLRTAVTMQAAPADKPALVDSDTWFGGPATSSAAPAGLAPGASLSVRANVYNAGTAAAQNVPVRFRLSTDAKYDGTDLPLGTATIGSIAPFANGVAELSAAVPAGASGDYFVVWAIDPDNVIAEYVTEYADFAGNTTHDLGANPTPVNVRPGPSGDRLEGNDAFASASPLGAVASRREEGLSLPDGDRDFFSLTAAAAGNYTVSAAPDAGGTAEVFVYDGNRSVIASGTAGTPVAFAGTAAAPYFVEVRSRAGETLSAYSLLVVGPTGIAPDASEPNGSFAQAAPIGLLSGTTTLDRLTIDAPGDDDLYSFTADATGTVTLTLAFRNAEGDLDLYAYDSTQQEIGRSDGTTDGEKLTISVAPGQTYYARVLGYEGATSPNYSLTAALRPTQSIQLPTSPPPVAADRFAGNNSAATAVDLGRLMVTRVEPGLSIDTPGVADFFRFTAPSDGTLTAVVGFNQEQGDLELFGLDAAGAEVSKSAGVRDEERVQFAVLAGQTYFVRVAGFGSSTNPDYTLSATFERTDPDPRGNPAARPSARYAAGTGSGPSNSFTLYEANGSVVRSVQPYPANFTGGVRTAVADVTGDGVADVVTGPGPGFRAEVKVFDGVTGTEVYNLLAFEESFTGGVFVAASDVDGDGTADIIVSPDETGGPRVRVFRGVSGVQLADFFGIEDTNFRGGVRVAAGDLNADGAADLVVAAGFGGGPRVAIFDGLSLRPGNEPDKLVGDFFAFEPALRNGTYAAIGDTDGDLFGDLVFGAGPGGGPRVLVVSGLDLVSGATFDQARVITNFFAGDPNDRGGVRVATKDVDGDRKADLLVGTGTDTPARAYVYTGATLSPITGQTPASELSLFGDDDGGVFVG